MLNKDSASNSNDDDIDYVTEKKRLRQAKKEAQKSSTSKICEGSTPRLSIPIVVETEEVLWDLSPFIIVGDDRHDESAEVIATEEIPIFKTLAEAVVPKITVKRKSSSKAEVISSAKKSRGRGLHSMRPSLFPTSRERKRMRKKIGKSKKRKERRNRRGRKRVRRREGER